MKNQTSSKFILAIAITIAGIFIVFNSLQRFVYNSETPKHKSLTDTNTQSGLEQSYLSPDNHNIDGIGSDIASRAIDLANDIGIVSESRRTDLELVVKERVRLFVDPDLGEYARFLQSRGAVMQLETMSEQSKNELIQYLSIYAHNPISCDGISVRALYVSGQPTEFANGDPNRARYSTILEDGPRRCDLPESVVRAKLDVVEICIPMKLPSMAGAEEDVLVSFSFAWNPQRRQWIPHATMLYSKQGIPFLSPPM